MRADQLPNMPGKICTMRHSAELQPRSSAGFGARYSPLALALFVALPHLAFAQAAEGRYSPLTQTQTSPWAAGTQPLYPLAKPTAVAPR